eukprot:4960428-Pyramimonas_sp.AAC.2
MDGVRCAVEGAEKAVALRHELVPAALLQCVPGAPRGADVKGNRADVKGNNADVKGSRADVKGNRADVKGNSADVKGDSADVKVDGADVKGDGADVKGNRADVRWVGQGGEPSRENPVVAGSGAGRES